MEKVVASFYEFMKIDRANISVQQVVNPAYYGLEDTEASALNSYLSRYPTIT